MRVLAGFRRRAFLATLAVFVGGCAVLQRTPPDPANAPNLPMASEADADSLLVDLHRIDSTFIIDMRYATAKNFTGDTLPGYEANRAYLRAEAAAALAVANEDLRVLGYTIKIFDAYRPVRATEAMVTWAQRTGRTNLLRDGYIASRSRHNLGVAVDLTLAVLATKAEITMGTSFDNFSRAAHTANARGIVQRNRQLLKRTMERQGFVGYEKEWWHFSYPVQNPVRFDTVVR